MRMEAQLGASKGIANWNQFAGRLDATGCPGRGLLVGSKWGKIGLSIAYCRSPIQPSETTIEFPGLWGSYFTDVGTPRRQE
jgi:hypothetical protein